MAWKQSKWVISLLLLFTVQLLSAQSDLVLDKQTWNDLRDKGKYSYEVEQPKPPPPPSTSTSNNWNPPNFSFWDWDLKGLMVPFVIIIVVLIVYLFARTVFGGPAKTARRAKARVNLDSIEEIPEEEELNEMRVEREKALDFREAIRVSYLKLLGWLSDKRLDEASYSFIRPNFDALLTKWKADV